VDTVLLSSRTRPDLSVLFTPASILGSGQSTKFAQDVDAFQKYVDKLEKVGKEILAIDLHLLEFEVRGDSVTLAMNEDDLGTLLDSARASLSFLVGHSGRTVRRLASISLPSRAPAFLQLMEKLTHRYRHIVALLAATLGEDDELAIQEAAVKRAPSSLPSGPSVQLDL